MAATCSICLDDLKNPVATPCAQPDLRFVPVKYHKFIIPSIRRVYFEAGPQNASASSSATGVDVQDLKDQITTLDSRVCSLARDKLLLMDRCERKIAESTYLADQERVARLESEALKKQVASLKKQLEESKVVAEESRSRYDGLKWRLKEYKSRLESPPAKASPPKPSGSAHKRTSTQAALDGTFLSRGQGQAEQDDNESSRPVLPMPKRPRLCFRPRPIPTSESPEKQFRVFVAPPVFKKRSPRMTEDAQVTEGQECKLFPTRTPTPYIPCSSYTSSPSRSAMNSSMMSLPGRSGLPTGDLFSPTRNSAVKTEVSDRSWNGMIGGDVDSAMAFAPGPSEERQRKYTFRGSRVVSIGNYKFSKVENE
ncbi:hypothetical protein EUX98_g7003 [Antrodiella citrinella]|uniref:Uncharacterized protein n=1 Tax=Antrodiella citrinella TaxID=2447956 RepID=A0A4S4MML8_9APHY|nr:hypothetical protein EUX98_g7003 [Antrodiella citrinella]